MKRTQLISAAKEINTVLGIEPPIKFGKTVTDEALTVEIIETAGEIDPELDEFSTETINTLTELGAWPGIGEDGDPDDLDDEEPELELDDEEPELELDDEEPAPAPKKGKIREIPAPAAKKEPAPAPVAKKSKVKPPVDEDADATGFTRVVAMATILKENPHLSKTEATKLSDALYCEKTGHSSNLKVQGNQYSRVIAVMQIFGF